MVAMTQITEKVPSFNFSDNANHAELEKLQNNSHSIHDDAAFDIEMAPNRGLMRANQKNLHLRVCREAITQSICLERDYNFETDSVAQDVRTLTEVFRDPS